MLSGSNQNQQSTYYNVVIQPCFSSYTTKTSLVNISASPNIRELLRNSILYPAAIPLPKKKKKRSFAEGFLLQVIFELSSNQTKEQYCA